MQPLAGQVGNLADAEQVRVREEQHAVVVAEPHLILAEPGGAGLLYIALTRAVQFLAVLYSDDLPALLADAAAA